MLDAGPNAGNVNEAPSPDEEMGFAAEAPVGAHPADLYRYDRFPHRYGALSDVDDAAVDFFHREGYLVIDRALGSEEVAAAGQALWHLVDGGVEEFRGITVEAPAREAFRSLKGDARRQAVRKLFRFVDVSPTLKSVAEHPGILDLVSRLMDDRPVLFQDMALLKPARIGREKPWHQDSAYFNVPQDTVIVGVWIAIDEATTDNGCLHLIPGSHREGPAPHFKRRDWQICDTDVKVDRDVVVPLDPGGCLIWHGLLHHGSPANVGGRGRRALQYHYKPSRATEVSAEERLAAFGGEGLGVVC